MHCLQQSQIQSLWRRVQAQMLQLFMRLFPWIHATQEGLRFGYQLLYLLDSSPFYTPTLHLLGQNIVRVSGQEMVSEHVFLDLHVGPDPKHCQHYEHQPPSIHVI